MTCRSPRAAAALAVLALLPLALHAAPKFSYEDWNKVLGKYVDGRGYVNYDALAADHGDLDRFVAAIEKTSPRSNPDLFPAKNDQLAYWLNAYNAQVFKGVLARGPEKESVWKGGLFSGYSFFVGMDIVLGGEKLDLKKHEDKTVRGGFKDPRGHAALNCASKGCPRLPQVAFDPEKLDEQLDEGMKGFVAEKRNVTIDDAAAIYVRDDTPSNETHYRTRFVFDPNALDVPSGNAVDIFYAKDINAGYTTYFIQMGKYLAEYRLYFYARNDSNQYVGSGWIPITFLFSGP